MEEWNLIRGLPIVVIVVLGLASMVGGTMYLRRQREHEWKTLARRLNLHFSHTNDIPHVSGTWHSRPVELKVSEDSSDVGGGVVVTLMQVGVQGVPPAMMAEGAPGIVGEMTNLAERNLLTGDENFDRNVHLTGTDVQTVRLFWNDQRKEAFLQLVASDRYDRLTLQEGNLSMEIRSLLTDHHELKRLLELLTNTAEQLESGQSEKHEHV